MLQCYIEPDASDTAVTQIRLSLYDDVVMPFLESDKEHVLIVLGDAGAGKSILTYALPHRLWGLTLSGSGSKKNPGFANSNYLPLRIELRAYSTDNVTGCIKKTFDELGIDGKASKNLPFLFILDGFDEIKGHADSNLYNECIRGQFFNAKLIVTCRSQHFANEELFRSAFRPSSKEGRSATTSIETNLPRTV